MQLKRISGLMVACLLVASLAAACSSSAKKVSASGANQSTTTAKAATSTTASSSSANSGGSADLSKCASASAAYAKVASGEESAFSSGKPFDAATFEKEYQAAGSLVPSKLKSDYDTVGTAVKQFATALQGVDLSNPSSYANPATAAKLQSASQAFDAPQVKAASQALDDYFKGNCN
jgi:hypothetical protein